MSKAKNPTLKQMQLKKLYPNHKAFSNPLNIISDIKLPVIDRSIEDNQTYRCIAFCYPQRGRSFIIRGNRHTIISMLMEYNVPMFVHFIVFSLTKKIIIDRSYNVFGSAASYTIHLDKNVNKNPYTGCASGSKRNTRNWITVMQGAQVVFSKKVRVFPRAWLKELDPYMSFVYNPVDNFNGLKRFISFKKKHNAIMFPSMPPEPSTPSAQLNIPFSPVLAPIKEVDEAFAARDQEAQAQNDTINMLKELGIFSDGNIMDMEDNI
jgi:hypothetical protein